MTLFTDIYHLCYHIQSAISGHGCLDLSKFRRTPVLVRLAVAAQCCHQLASIVRHNKHTALRNQNYSTQALVGLQPIMMLADKVLTAKYESAKSVQV